MSAKEPISDGIVAYFKTDNASWPQARLDAVDPSVRSPVKRILEYADTLEPDWMRLDLEQAGEWARTQFVTRYPYLTDEALGALVGACTFGWK